MRALIFEKTGNPEDVLKVAEIEKPTPGPGEALIKVAGNPINPADVLFIQGRYRYKPQFPQTAGLEGAGTVEAVGENVKLKPNALVAFMQRNSWAEYVIVPENELVPLPTGFPPEKAIQFCLNPFTAWTLLEDSAVQSGDWLLLTAANSAVSKVAIQLAKSRGVNTIAVVRHMEEAEELKALGADAVLKADADDFETQISHLTEGNGVNAVLEAVGGPTGTKVLKQMAPNGTAVIYGLLSGEPVQLDYAQMIFKNLNIKGFGVRQSMANQTPQQREKMIQTLTTEIGKPAFQLPVEVAFRYDEFKEALELNGRSKRKGKVIFKT